MRIEHHPEGDKSRDNVEKGGYNFKVPEQIVICGGFVAYNLSVVVGMPPLVSRPTNGYNAIESEVALRCLVRWAHKIFMQNTQSKVDGWE